MAGKYVTQSRSDLDPVRYTYGVLGTSTGDQHIETEHTGGSFQTTFSFRTGGEVESDPVLDARRNFRNGFKTFDPVFDRGHEFWTERRYTHRARGQSFYMIGSTSTSGSATPNRFLRGELMPRIRTSGAVNIPGNSSFYPSVSPLSQGEGTFYGQRAINATAPTAPQANAAVFIGELFAGLPQLAAASIFRDQALTFRNMGGEYLNVQFGWLPFIADIRKTVGALKRSTDILMQLSRDNGRNVRRRFAFPETREVVELSPLSPTATEGPLVMTSPTTFFDRTDPSYSSQVSRTQITTRKMWFSGAFAYSIPTDSSVMSKLERFSAQADVLLGSRLTPEVLWELAPWSWLIDWKLGIGTALSAATRLSQDGLVLRYGYLMCHTTRHVQYHVSPIPLRFAQGRTPPITATLFTERKERVRATPYGFGLNPASFSATQWAVLAALGMTKGNATLIRAE